ARGDGRGAVGGGAAGDVATAGDATAAGNGTASGAGDTGGPGEAGAGDTDRATRPDTRGDQARQVRNGRTDEDGDGGGRRGRRGRGERAPAAGEGEPQVSEDDVLVPVAGILDVLDNYAFIRTSGYLAGPNDVYVSMAQVRKYGLRRGDAVTGAVRANREGEGR